MVANGITIEPISYICYILKLTYCLVLLLTAKATKEPVAAVRDLEPTNSSEIQPLIIKGRLLELNDQYNPIHQGTCSC